MENLNVINDVGLESVKDIIHSLSSTQKLERDRVLEELLSNLSNYDPNVIDWLYSTFIAAIRKRDCSWESYYGVMLALQSLLLNKDSSTSDAHLLNEIRLASLALLVHPEVRIREASGDVLGALCKIDDCATYQLCKAELFQLIHSNLERKLHDYEEVEVQEDVRTASRAEILHDTAGWRNLETSMRCLQSIIDASGVKFLPFIDQELLEILFISVKHENRFVRETSFSLLASLVSCGAADDESGLANPVVLYGDQLCSCLATGLADNWSQVRMASSVATRKFLMILPENIRHKFFPHLLPRICLNRYYIAEGVRLYSQETWRLVTEEQGKALIEEYLSHVVDYYIEATKSDNHAVREAACACIAEVGLKLPHSSVQPHIFKLLQCLTVCFTDDSWPVRDAACLACGNFISCFPEESATSLATLLPLFFANLEDTISSVRQGGATAVTNVVKTYKSETAAKVLEFMKEGFEGVKAQPSEVIKYGDLSEGPATYGVVKQKRDNDPNLHTDRQMYSCGSLAPKMGRGGCSDCRFKRPSQPWEKADGCLYLMGSLASAKILTEELTRLLPLVASACSHRHYTAHLSLLETFCKILPIIGNGLSKKILKQNLELFFDHIFYALECENALTSSAASQCLHQLSQFLGPNILRGRLEIFNPLLLSTLEKHI